MAIWFNWQGEYYNFLPQIFLEFSGLQNGGMGRYPSPNAATRIHFYYLKNSVQFLTIFVFFDIISNQLSFHVENLKVVP